MDSSSPAGAAVSATGFGVRGPRGWAVRDITFEAEPGALVAVEGPSGSGRTCLLLALTGRMRAHAGHAEIAGLRLAGSGRAGSRRAGRMAAVRRLSALGPVPGVSELEPSLTVAEHLRERALLQRRFGGSPFALLRPRAERAADIRERTGTALRTAGLDPDTLPKGARTAVRDLDRLESLRLSVALALVSRPRLLAVDDADLKLSAAERTDAWAMLRGVAAAGTTVLAVCGEAPEDAVRVRTGAGDRTRPERTGEPDERAAEPRGRAGKPDEQAVGPRAQTGKPDEQAGKPEGTRHTDRADRTGSAGSPEQSRRADGTSPADRTDPADRTGRADRASPADRTDPANGTGLADRTDPADPADPTDRPDPPHRPDPAPGTARHEANGTGKGAASGALAETRRA
ncbi:ATP-binding cassette domain-containing protein [Streptomyces sp. NPDC048845]|uniref:ATP-binding cassette domain-containing protein n=1 Tax=Streptomyces sp. NPDC048845 TaxID=3155390 RepID=UPI00341C93B5